jgi:probable HAF family extracellular repeat protein
MNSLGTLGGDQSVAMDINDTGRVVGGAQNASQQFRPFRWNDGTMTDLGTLGGDSTFPDHRAEAVNSFGLICGRSYTAGDAKHAFFWDGSMNDLGVLTGGTQSWAFGINDSDVIVGTSNVTGGAFRAFVWDSTDGMRNLNNLLPTGTGWTLIRATDINNNGMIVGFGTNGSAQNRAFLLTPTCGAGGGGAAAAAVIAGGSGDTDENGAFVREIVTEEGDSLARIEITNPEPEIRVDYTLINWGTGSTAGGTPGEVTQNGLATGSVLPRRLNVATTAVQPAASMFVVRMIFTSAEFAAIGVTPAELAMHELDPGDEDRAAIWVIAGRSIGELPPSGELGTCGFTQQPDGTVEYWTVRNSGGVFAVGRTAPPQQDRPPGFSICGTGMLMPFLLCLLSLLGIRSVRRR